MQVEATIHHSWFDAVLADVRLRGDCIIGYRIFVGEDDHLLQIRDCTSDEERSDRPSSQNEDVEDVIIFFVRPSYSQSIAAYSRLYFVSF